MPELAMPEALKTFLTFLGGAAGLKLLELLFGLIQKSVESKATVSVSMQNRLDETLLKNIELLHLQARERDETHARELAACREQVVRAETERDRWRKEREDFYEQYQKSVIECIEKDRVWSQRYDQMEGKLTFELRTEQQKNAGYAWLKEVLDSWGVMGSPETVTDPLTDQEPEI